MALRLALDRHLPAVDALLRDILASPSDSFKSLYGMAQYHHGWLDEALLPTEADSGKRLRPVLCLLSCEACGGDAAAALPVAGAIELLHSFSLVHDDIQDESPLRRHRPTVWALWGAPQAINVGDLLYAEANRCLLRLVERVPEEVTLAVLEGFQTTCVRLCEGQYLDMVFETQAEVTEDAYFAMIERKTAALVSFATWSGAIASGAGPERARHMHEFGRGLGLAFQIQDDVLGIWGEESETGKSVSSDILSAKKTLPLLHALGRLPDAEARQLSGLYAAPNRGGAQVEQARHLIERSGARGHCESLAAKWYERALASLSAAQPEPEPAAALRELLQSLTGRRA